jgi:CheY-like chemotaxis protein
MKHSSTLGGARILFVYENAEALSWNRLLENTCYQISAVHGCDAAIQQIENGLQPDLILLNLDAPSLDDLRMIEACRRIRAEQTGNAMGSAGLH